MHKNSLTSIIHLLYQGKRIKCISPIIANIRFYRCTFEVEAKPLLFSYAREVQQVGLVVVSQKLQQACIEISTAL